MPFNEGDANSDGLLVAKIPLKIKNQNAFITPGDSILNVYVLYYLEMLRERQCAAIIDSQYHKPMALFGKHCFQLNIQPFKAIPVIEDGRNNTKCTFLYHLSLKKSTK